MAKRTIFSLNTQLPGDEDEYIDFRSDRSLLDADIIVASPNPNIRYQFASTEDYNGKPLLSHSASFKAIEAISHWRSELRTALESGKTVFFFLRASETFYVYTGSKDFSGTGRSRTTTHHVAPHENYEILPIKIGQLTSRRGKKIKAISSLGPLAIYWQEFGPMSQYEAYLDKSIGNAFLGTKTGGKIVATIISVGKGHLVLLPPLDYDNDKLSDINKDTGDLIWNKKGIIFGKRLASVLAESDRALRSGGESTPPPTWTHESKYALQSESTIEKNINSISTQIEDLQIERIDLQKQLEKESILRSLLFEKGKQLEAAILEALLLLGFEAEPYQDAESEFDAVFSSPEGRFIGEAEGKDRRAINIDKLSQLERGLQEDFARDEISEYAKGVLLGNAHRLEEPGKRPSFFTQKCVSGAKRSRVALVRTVDLFAPAKYLKENKDPEFARECREAIQSAEGDIVEFPKIPKKGKNEKQKEQIKIT